MSKSKRTETPPVHNNPNAQQDALTALRTETALSRFPLHSLTKGKNTPIELTNHPSAVLWRVDHNNHYGQPGALAYKLDTWVINRRIEESGQPIPKILRLGSLREIAAEIGSPSNTNPVKQALLQNATASITAKITFKTTDKGQKDLEAVFQRYSIVFTGEKLPDGRAADAVYLILNDIYQTVLNSAIFRPLDYEYMKSLPPISQRFYEIVSYQVYAALKYGNPRAKLAYSEYCQLSTATRYPDFEHVKKQMYKILRPHVQSGYIAKIQYEATTDSQGNPDWIMYLTPGINANREYKSFTGNTPAPKRRKPNKEHVNLELPFPDATNAPIPTTTDLTEHQELLKALINAELNQSDAEHLAREYPDICRQQLAYLPYVEHFKTSKGAYLRSAIEGNWGPPTAYSQTQQKQAEAEATRKGKAEIALREAEKKSRKAHEERHHADFCDFICLGIEELKKTHPELITAFTAYEDERHESLVKSPMAERPMFKATIEKFNTPTLRAQRFIEFCKEQKDQFLIEIPTFWEWDESHNTTPFSKKWG